MYEPSIKNLNSSKLKMQVEKCETVDVRRRRFVIIIIQTKYNSSAIIRDSFVYLQTAFNFREKSR